MPPENPKRAEYDALQKYLASQELVALELMAHKTAYDKLLEAQVMATRAMREFVELYRRNRE